MRCITGFTQQVVVHTSNATYLSSLKTSFSTEWPKNKTINLVFHGHSVPSGYFKTPQIQTLQSYPELTLQYLSEKYPTAVINAIKTCIGGENSEQGAARFDTTVLNYKPDILFIDYALNDRGIGLQRAKIAWQSMIEKALKQHIKVVLFTPTPDQSENIADTSTLLFQHTQQILALANQYQIAVVDSYNAFRLLVANGEKVSDYMSQVNHPNAKGHQVVLKEIEKLFEE
ncbi:MAG: SGNH/GDSL hydrolase family protein [Agriterribacter sp.]